MVGWFYWSEFTLTERQGGLCGEEIENCEEFHPPSMNSPVFFFHLWIGKPDIPTVTGYLLFNPVRIPLKSGHFVRFDADSLEMPTSMLLKSIQNNKPRNVKHVMR